MTAHPVTEEEISHYLIWQHREQKWHKLCEAPPMLAAKTVTEMKEDDLEVVGCVDCLSLYHKIKKGGGRENLIEQRERERSK